MRIIALGCIVVFMMFTLTAVASDVQAMTDRLFSDLADIIERNMDSPQQAVSQVRQYYENNRVLVERISQEAARLMEPKITGVGEEIALYQKKIMEAASRGDEAEIERLGRKLEAMAGESRAPSFDRSGSVVAQRYSRALETFIRRYPQEGLQISMEAQRLMPQAIKTEFGW